MLNFVFRLGIPGVVIFLKPTEYNSGLSLTARPGEIAILFQAANICLVRLSSFALRTTLRQSVSIIAIRPLRFKNSIHFL